MIHRHVLVQTRLLRASVAALALVGILACAPTARASATIGVEVAHLTEGSESGCAEGVECTFYQGGGSSTNKAIPAFTSPMDGMIVRWRLGAGSAGDLVKLRVVRPVEGKLIGAGTGAQQETTIGVDTFEDERIPVKAGDAVGVDNEDSALILAPPGPGVQIVEYFQPYLPDSGPPLSPSNEISARRLELDADIVGLPNSTGKAGSCPGEPGATVTVTSDSDPSDGPKAVRYRIDGGGEQVAPTTSTNPGTASLTVPAGVHSLEYWGEDVLGQQQATHSVLTVGCPLPPSTTTTGGAGTTGTGTASTGTATAAVVSNASESSRRWREGSALAAISGATRAPLGTTFSFGLNEAASVAFKFTQAVPGLKLGSHCVRPGASNRKRAKCTRTVVRGVMTFAGHAGVDKVRFQGRLSRSRKLKPGRYTLIITATDATGHHSSPVPLRFTIVASRRR